jgi:hypothetical protein
MDDTSLKIILSIRKYIKWYKPFGCKNLEGFFIDYFFNYKFIYLSQFQINKQHPFYNVRVNYRYFLN